MNPSATAPLPVIEDDDYHDEDLPHTDIAKDVPSLQLPAAGWRSQLPNYLSKLPATAMTPRTLPTEDPTRITGTGAQSIRPITGVN